MNPFLKQISVTIPFLCLLIGSNVLCMVEKPLASDVQIYQLLSTTEKNPLFNLPRELVHLIMHNAYAITERLKYRSHFNDPETIVNFIDDCVNKSMSDESIIDIAQTCLSYSNKSLGEIKDIMDQTVFHKLFSGTKYIDTLNCARIIRLMAKNQAWDLICMQDMIGFTALTWAKKDSAALQELLLAIPDDQVEWESFLYDETIECDFS